MTEGSISTTYNSDKANEITSDSSGLVYPADGNGNLLGINSPGGGTDFSWDALNRLITVRGSNIASPLAQYVYNGDNLRVQKTNAAGVVTRYVMDGTTPLLETDQNNVVKRMYNPSISVTDASGNKFYYLHDIHGNTNGLLDKDGNIVQSYTYDAFGALIDGTTDKFNGLRYVGLGNVYSDHDVGLQYMWNRWYDPQLGRFISRDPIGFAGGLNLYSYSRNNPMSRVDPMGLCSENHTNGDLSNFSVAWNGDSSSSGGLNPANDTYMSSTAAGFYGGTGPGSFQLNGTAFGAYTDLSLSLAGVGGYPGAFASAGIAGLAGQSGLTENNPGGIYLGLGGGLAGAYLGMEGAPALGLGIALGEFDRAVSPSLGNFGRNLALMEIAFNQRLQQQRQGGCK